MVFNCKICGGALDIKKNNRIVTCPYCGVQQTLPRTDNNEIVNLYERANHFLRCNDYDKAESIYNTILSIDSTDAEAYWSIVLCKYGVEYVKDPSTEEYIPTCNRTQKNSIFSDIDYKQTIENSTEEEKEMYQKQAEKINEIQKKILEISRKEPAYDVFICYKEKDAKGERTQDSVLAQDIYTKLMSEGFRVFFSRITLEDKLGTEYEPYIYAALNSSKVMLVIGTSKEYFYAPWVKNEWSRYLALTKQDKEKILIPCFKDMDAYDIPEEFAHIQAQDIDKIGFMQDLVRGIKKVLESETNQPKGENGSSISTAQKEEIYSSCLENMQELENKKIINRRKKIKKYSEIEKNLKIIGNYKDAGILLNKCTNLKKIEKKKATKSFIIKTSLILIIVLSIYILSNKFYFQPQEKYDLAIEKYQNKEYYNAIELFSQIENYKDSKNKIEESKLKWRKSNSNIMCTVNQDKMESGLLAVKQIGSVVKIGGNNIEQITEPLKLKTDGTVEITFEEYSFLNEEIKNWTDIVSISASDYYVFGVTKNGTVKSVKYKAIENENEIGSYNLDVSTWENIIQVVPCLLGGVVGLKEDGTVVSKGLDKSCILAVKEWQNVIQLAGSNTFLVALKNDGTVDRVFSAPYETLELQNETNVIQLSKNDYYSNNVSLIKLDGNVVTYGDNSSNQCETNNWENIVYVYSNFNGVYGVTSNGTIEKAGYATKYDEALYWTGIRIDDTWRSVQDEPENFIESEQSQEIIENGDIEQNELQGEVINNGTSKISYNGYTYIHEYDEELNSLIVSKCSNSSTEQNRIITYKNESGYVHYNLWIYNDKLYLQIDNMLKCYDLDGKDEQIIAEVGASNDVQIDIDKELAIYTEYNKSSYLVKSIEIVKLDGTRQKSISLDSTINNLNIVKTNGSDYLFFSSSESNIKSTSTVCLYMLNKSNYEFTKITSEELNEGWYGCGIYQAEFVKDHIYYIAGSMEGTGGYFNGNAYRIKKDGTEKEILKLSYDDFYEFSDNVIPSITVTQNYVYYSGIRINIETNKKEIVQFENGDIIDDNDNIYTVSMSTDKEIILAKYKVGADLSEAITLFSRTIPNGITVDSQKIQIKAYNDYVYITIDYTDLDDQTGIRAWKGVNFKTETYRIKSDGSEIKKIQ